MSVQPSITTEQRLIFENQGYLHLPGAIGPRLVDRVRLAFDAASEAYTRGRRSGSSEKNGQSAYYDVPSILDCDDCFIDLVDLPGVIPILLALMGDIQLNHTHARVFLPGKTFTAPWHSDLANVLGIDLAHTPNFMLKVHYYFEDLRPDQGCLGFLPGTHRLPPDVPRPTIADVEHSAAVKKIVPKAGDAVIFNTHVLHMAFDNASGLARKSLIYAYSHCWVKNYANAVPANPERFGDNRLRRQLLGYEEEGVSFFDQRYDNDIRPATGLNSIQTASLRVLRRLRQASSMTR